MSVEPQSARSRRLRIPKPGGPSQPSVADQEVEQAIAQMADCIVSAGSVHQALKSQLSVIFELLHPKACYTVRHASKRGELLVMSSRGRTDARICASKPGQGPVGRAFAEARIVRADGVVAVPLIGKKSVTGCLAILSPRRNATDFLLTALAAQVTAAAEVAQLRDEMARRNKDLQTALAGLRSLQKSRELLISNVSHELNNPLTPIKLYLNMFARGTLGELSDRQVAALRVIERNADRLARMISDLMLMSRLESGRMTLHQRAFGLKASAERAVQVLKLTADQAKVALRLGAGPEVFVRGDPDRIGNVIYNLVENAILAAGEGGEAEVTLSTKSGLAILGVRDSGRGIPAKDQERIFDLTAVAGAGEPRVDGRLLSLPIVARIVQLHGGRTEVESKLGRGSTFRIYLPLFAAVTVSKDHEIAAASEGKILLVEDNADVREVLQDVLQQHGFSVIASSTAAQALAHLRESRPALVLLDWRLTDDDGRSVLNFIRFTPSLAKTKVFVISGGSEIGSLSCEQGPERIDEFFEKPLHLPKLITSIASVVRPQAKT